MWEKLSGQPINAEEEIHKSSLKRLNSQKEDHALPDTQAPSCSLDLVS